MAKRNWVISLLAAVCLIGAGCSGQTAKVKEAKAAEKQQQIEKEKKLQEEKKLAEAKKREEERKREEARPVYVNIVDPNTKDIVKTFNTKDLEYITNPDNYKVEISKLTRELARGTQSKPGYDKRMILDKLDEEGNIIKGTPQQILDEEELADKIMLVSEKGGNVELPLYVNASGYQADEASQLDDVVVASYTTHFNSGTVGRTKNIKLSAEAINNVILGTNDSFSYNTTVGPSDAEHGYQKAPEINYGKLVEGYGGGICQTSSTLYNAIDQLAVQYIEKHHHSLTVGYVPKGRDATVSYGGKDFRFKNTTGVPLILKATVNGGSLTVEVRTSKTYQSQLKKRI
ncbi:VanW family protein [Neobacillus sp. MER 74]|uniref:VanW family protein n=1 Tax=Neobacillus sp. MER 74 TaxID=2939566 RepID=UPI00203FBB13|nr:VanW family protein [Neobacillus sp. MER 74]MCM3116781.1 VanW family protein [Neobacillus sp. MER 74]